MLIPPRRVPIHIAPSEASQIARTVLLRNAGTVLESNTTNLLPSYFTNPSSVPNHKYPSRVWTRAAAEFCGNPSSVWKEWTVYSCGSNGTGWRELRWENTKENQQQRKNSVHVSVKPNTLCFWWQNFDCLKCFCEQNRMQLLFYINAIASLPLHKHLQFLSMCGVAFPFCPCTPNVIENSLSSQNMPSILSFA